MAAGDIFTSDIKPKKVQSDGILNEQHTLADQIKLAHVQAAEASPVGITMMKYKPGSAQGNNR